MSLKNNIEKKDNRIDLDSSIWGSKGWFFLDSVCLAYPDNPTKQEKQQYKYFFNALSIIGPCTKCRVHFNNFIKKYPLNNNILKSKDNLILWILTAHNNVKKINGEKQIKLEDFYKYYNNMYKTDVKINGCKDKCALTNLPNNLISRKESELNTNNINNTVFREHMNEKITVSNNYKFISILFFGVIIALSLYIYRSIQITM